MVKLTRDDVLKLAGLAQLDLTDEEIESFQVEISELLQYVEQLQTVDVSGFQPTAQVTGLSDVTRPDEEYNYGMSRDDLLSNVPEVENGQIKVKRVIE